MWFNSQIKYKWIYFVYLWPGKVQISLVILFIYLFVRIIISPLSGGDIVFPIVCLSVCLSQIVFAQFVLLCFPHLGETYSFSHSCLYVCLSVCPSVCLSNHVHSITLLPFEILSRNLTKIIAQSDDVQRTSTVTPPTFWTELCPFETCSMEIETLSDSFMKVGTNIKHNRTICREQIW